jgi:hypothetical protein
MRGVFEDLLNDPGASGDAWTKTPASEHLLRGLKTLPVSRRIVSGSFLGLNDWRLRYGVRIGQTRGVPSGQSVCERCVFHRLTPTPDPLDGVRLASTKLIELRARWHQELAERATAEDRRFVSGEAFDFPPISYPWCEHFSSEAEVPDPVTGRIAKLYVTCAQANPDGRCESFQEKPK